MSGLSQVKMSAFTVKAGGLDVKSGVITDEPKRSQSARGHSKGEGEVFKAKGGYNHTPASALTEALTWHPPSSNKHSVTKKRASLAKTGRYITTAIFIRSKARDQLIPCERPRCWSVSHRKRWCFGTKAKRYLIPFLIKTRT
jgi:hypothetical protein